MNWKLSLLEVALTVFLVGAGPSHAWGPQGHRVSAGYAEQLLSSPAPARRPLLTAFSHKIRIAGPSAQDLTSSDVIYIFVQKTRLSVCLYCIFNSVIIAPPGAEC